MSPLLQPDDTPESFYLAELDFCHLRLFNQADLLWLLLVPKREGVIELIDLSHEEQLLLLNEINFISHLVKNNFPCDKLNIATLGNMTPTLHIHIIARRKNDPYFPKAPFGLQEVKYTAAAKNNLIQHIRGLLIK